MSDHNLAEALPHFDDMTALQRRLHNAAIVLGADGDEYGFEGLLREAIVALAAREAWQQPLYTSPKLRALIDRVQAEQQAGEAVARTFEDWARSRGLSPDKLDSANCWVRVAYDEARTHPQQPLTEIRRLAIIMQARTIREAIEMTEDAHGITKDTK